MASEVAQLIRTLAKANITDATLRKELYDASIELMQSTESAQDTAQRLYHSQLPLATAQMGLDIQLFSFLSSCPGSPFSSGELAQITGVERSTLSRLLRYYAAHGMVRQVAKDTYTASNITHNLAVAGTAAGIKHYWLTMSTAYNAIPTFFKQNDYKHPADRNPFNTGFNTELPVFEWRKHNPENAKTGQAFMAAQRIGQKSVWEGLVPLDDFKLSPEDQARDRVMLCDIGGGSGHQCLEFRQYHPEIKGRIVTEDLPNIQAMVPDMKVMKDHQITFQPHDFMQEQPIKGAKVYYLRNVIHNWNDEASKVILSQTAKAMAPDSVVIIDDVVLADGAVTWKQANMDLAMMTMLGAMERSKDHFARLLRESGLKLRDVSAYDADYGDAFITAVLDPAQAVNAHATSGVAVTEHLVNGHASNDTATNGSPQNKDSTWNAPVVTETTLESKVNGTALDGQTPTSDATNGPLETGNVPVEVTAKDITN